MANKIYNQQKVVTSEASVGGSSLSGRLIYRGFNSRKRKDHFKENDVALIKQDLLNHFNIRKGEKLEQPNFGTIIWSMVFEPMTEDNVQKISDDVSEIINRDPRVTPNNITVDSTEQGIRVECDLQFTGLDQTERLRLDFNRTQEN